MSAFTMNEAERIMFDQMYARSCEVIRHIEQPKRDDIYVLSFHINGNPWAAELDVGLGYNTLTRWRSCTPAPVQEPRWPVASSSREAKWNFAFWLQESYKPVLAPVPADQDLRIEWLRSIGCYYTAADEDADFHHTLALSRSAENRFGQPVTEVALRLRANDLIRKTFGRDLPVLVHEVHQNDSCVEPTKQANQFFYRVAVMPNAPDALRDDKDLTIC